MKWIKICILALLLSVSLVQAHAQAYSLRSTVIIGGKVIDKNSLKPVSGAQVYVFGQDFSENAVTKADGSYIVSLRVYPRYRYGYVCIYSREYEADYKLLFLTPWSQAVKIDFRLCDYVKPMLDISSPVAGQEIFPDSSIEFRYSDKGSGVNLRTLKICAGAKDITKYVKFIDGQKAVCAVARNDLLPLGLCKIFVCLKDYAGNYSEKSLFVTIVDKSENLVNLGKRALLRRDTQAAYNYFAQSLASNSYNSQANFYFAFTRLLLLPQKNEIFNLLRDMGFKGPKGAALTQSNLNLFNLQCEPPKAISKFYLEPSFPKGMEFQKIINKTVIYEIDKSLANLDIVLQNKNFVSYLEMPNPFTGSGRVEIDYGDVALLKSLILVFKSNMLELLVPNFDVDLARLSGQVKDGTFSAESLLRVYPELLRVRDIQSSQAARSALVEAIDSYNEAFTFILNESDDQSDDLISISSALEYRNQAIAFVEELKDVKKSLLGVCDNVFSLKMSQVVDLSAFYNEPFDLRRLLDNDAAMNIFDNVILPKIDYAQRNLAKVASGYQERLPYSGIFYGLKQNEVDYGDVLVLASGANAMQAGLLSTLAYNLYADAQGSALKIIRGEKVSFRDILSRHPYLFTLSNPRYLITARNAASNLERNYSLASDYLLYRDDVDQSDDVFVRTEYFVNNASRYSMMLRSLSSMGNTLIDPRPEITRDNFRVNPGEFFLRFKNVRDFLPRFNADNSIIPKSWPDDKFGGIVPDNKLN
ncbi:MAG: hypothetical protein V1650_04625 [Candidatus Omnitrophota bacterium]